MVGVLSGQSCWWTPAKLAASSSTSHQTPKKATWDYSGHGNSQKAALDNIEQWVATFCAAPLAQVDVGNFEQLIKQKSIDYAGEEVGHALPLKLGELEPGLPLAGVAGSLSAVDAASSQVKAWVSDRILTLKDKKLWPPNVPTAKINATRQDWYQVVEASRRKGIVAPIDFKTFAVN